MIRTLAETGSTNADLLASLRAGERVAEGDWLVADRQVSGRGRQGRNWSDGTGNFMGSTIITVSPGGPPAASLAFVTGLALYEAVAATVPVAAELSLKWPNDLLLRGAKLAGILLERQGDAIVAGFGVNLAQAPSLPDRRTISLADLGPPPDRDLFAQRLADSMALELVRWRDYGIDPILRRWHTAAHPPGTRLVIAPPGEQSIEGEYAGLATDGALRLRLADGGIRAIHAGDVMLPDGDR